MTDETLTAEELVEKFNKAQRNARRAYKIYGIFFTLMSAAGFIWLLTINWKIGICVFLILWANNSGTKK